MAAASALMVATGASAVAPQPAPNCVAGAPAVFSTTTDVAIGDLSTATSTVAVSGLTGQILDIDVTTQILHTDPGDLAITLTSPTGKEIELSVGNAAGSVNAFNGTVWDDDADPGSGAQLVTDHTYASGAVATPLVPQEALAAFIGDNPNGTWALTVEDLAPSDVGVIDGWSVAIVTGTTGATASAQSGPAPIAPLSIADGATVRSQISQGTFALATVRDVHVSTSITFDDVGDLRVTLTSPAGTVVTLSSGNGAGFSGALPFTWGVPSGPYTGQSFTSPVTRIAPPWFGEFAPEESFGAFFGEDPKGLWTLTVTDTNPGNGTVGTLAGWSLSVRTDTACAPTIGLTQSAAPSIVPVGGSFGVDLTAKNTGRGYASDLTISGVLPPIVRVAALTPSAGGTCVTSPELRCAWPGLTAPGTDRTVHLDLQGYIVGRGVLGWRIDAARNVSIPQSTSDTPLTAFSVTTSALRAATGQRCTVVGTNGPDVLRKPAGLLGAPGVYCGLGGNDRLVGGSEADVFDGGSGRDVIQGGRGNDVINGGGGGDILDGGQGADTIRGGAGADRLTGGPGRDTLIGGTGRDISFAASGDRQLGIEVRA